MDRPYLLKYHVLEEKHWWFQGRRDTISRLIRKYSNEAEILDVGCSGGVLMETLKKQGFERLYGIDIDEEAVALCRQKGFANVHIADAEKTGFVNQQFDLIIASDVLEHMKDEDKALNEWHRILKPDGKIIIFVPAFQFLWRGHDEVNRHYRRYRKTGLVKTLERNGFKADRASYWNFSLFFPLSLLVLTQRIFSNSHKISDQLFEISPLINTILIYLLKMENKLLSWNINLPFGVSAFAVAVKA